MTFDYRAVFGSKKLILFDIDGTLVNILQMHIDILADAYHEHAGIKPRNNREVSKHFGVPTHEMARNFLTENKITHDEKMIHNIVDYHFEKIAARAHEIATGNVIPGVTPLLTKLKKDHKTIMTITGGTRKMSTHILEQTKLLPYLDETIFSDDLYHGKKIKQRSQMLEIAFEKAVKKDPSLTRKDCIVVGDTPNDILAARAAQMDSIGVGTGSHTEEEIMAQKPTYWIPHF